MSQGSDVLERIAAALERMAPPPGPPTDWRSHPAYVWTGGEALALTAFDTLPLDQLRGIEAQKRDVCDNIGRLASGAAAHDMLLWGARGMGKSALIRAAIADANSAEVALVQITTEGLAGFAHLVEALAMEPRAFLLFLDDLGFGEGDVQANLALRSLLDGGALTRPPNVRLAVTSNRRAIVQRDAQDGEALHERDERDNALALADRFGLTLAFHPCDQATYLEILRSYADPLGIEVDEEEANAWAIARGNRSGRTAYQFACELAGRAGLAL